MRILIQNCKTYLYLKAPGEWTASADEATDFKRSVDALTHCAKANLEDVQIVLKFPTGLYDVNIAATDGCRKVA
ncbi:hypothetical protein [Pedosphaera parvula]|uniref:Uncharacterized protein n=1 Tax=Pedosphaera parvula (strain Ellin514) TaxID=320771 RepID=B9XEQ3_PEDPL|nr:hypothetical protein [Pedosphaera parvula]EEF61767.1 hypothetical protein Cflav_PD4807 [Pedosphaera parvula Ellin514]